MMLWKETEVLWSTYYVLLRTLVVETWLTFLMETRLQDCHLLTGVCVGGGGRRGVLGCSCTGAKCA